MRSPRLSQTGEFGWLKRLIPKLYWPGRLKSQLVLGAGDDAGAIRVSPGKVLVATTDTLAEGIHFEHRWFQPRDLGEKLLAVNLSDLAAMGDVKPLAALVTVSLPGDTAVETVDKFYKGLRKCAQRWQIGFLGGDTIGSKRDWVVSATVLGEAHPRHLIRRSGARVGDWIGVVGPLGLAAAGLEVLQKGFKAAWTAPLLAAFCRPQPQFKAGAVLAKNVWASSLIDASDGLEASLRLLAQGSRLGVHLELQKIQIHPALSRWSTLRRKPVLDYLLRGGEDYALVFTASPRDWPKIQKQLPQARAIGQMTARKKGLWAWDGTHKQPLKSYGYAHF